MNRKTALELFEYWIEQYYRINGTPTLDDIKGQINLLKDYEREQLHIADAIGSVALHIHYDLSLKAKQLMKQHNTMKAEDFRELPEVKKLWSAMDVIKQHYL